MSLPDVLTRMVSRLEVVATSIRSRVTIPRWVIVPVVIVLVGLSAFAWRQLPPERSPSYPALGAVALLGVISMAMNSVEFRVTAVLSQTTVPPLVAMRTVLAGTIANILPLPGSQLVRAGVLNSQGVPMRRALSMSLLVGLVWIVIAVVTAMPLLAVDLPSLSVVPLMVAFSVSAVTATIMAERSRRAMVTITALVMTECSLVFFQIARLLLIGHALGIEIDLSGSAALAVAATIATGAALLPSGLGLREGMSVLVGPLGGIGRAESLVMSVFDQAIAYGTIAVVAVVLTTLRFRPREYFSDVSAAETSQDTGSAT